MSRSIATVDPDGVMQISDRAKAVIKSVGEWICSQRIENLVLMHPATAGAAVVAEPSPQWSERPVLAVQPKPGLAADAASLHGHLARAVPGG